MIEDKVLAKQLEDLSTKFLKQEDADKVKIWREGIEKSARRLKLLQSDVMQEIIEQMQKWVDDVNDTLLNKRDLSDAKRENLFERRDAWTFLRGLFLFDTQRIETMGKNIDEAHKEKTLGGGRRIKK
jgi:hypothetical protein